VVQWRQLKPKPKLTWFWFPEILQVKSCSTNPKILMLKLSKEQRKKQEKPQSNKFANLYPTKGTINQKAT
jgi:hypothetical protein